MREPDAKTTIRPALVADLPAILEIYNYAVRTSTATADYDPQGLEAREMWYWERVSKGFAVLVATHVNDCVGVGRANEAAGTVIGWGSLSAYHPRIGYRFSAETSIYLDQRSRGRGIGALILDELVAAARKQGLHALFAKIDSGNEASIRLHARAGFIEAGRLREAFCKFGEWLDVVYMELLLDNQRPTEIPGA